ncbi:AsmA family protein [Dyella subtropica]|uniref:AsmA family protein n=1 Tax=Dyella subtropica TaxID=2992127 RepID=UPI002257F981|nr:AsmA family protein [Dyella subtropica]
MKRSRRVLFWMASVPFMTLAAAFVVIATYDWSRIKPGINEKVSQAIGRPFAIQGDLTVAWRREPNEGGLNALVPWPEFVAKDIRIANTGWAKQPQFAQLDAVRFRLAPLPLLSHRLVIPSLQLEHPVIDLERDAQGRASWDFAMPPSSEPSAWQLDLQAIGFDRGVIELDDAASKVKLKITVEPLQQAIPFDQIMAQQATDAREQAGRTAGSSAKKVLANAKEKDEDKVGTPASATTYLFAWQADGSYEGTPLKGSGKTGGVIALQQDDRPFPVQADVHIGDSHIALAGTLTDPMHLGALDLKLWFSGTSMAKLYPITGLTLPDTPPYATEGHLKAELHRSGSHYSYRNFRGRVGGSDLAGSLEVSTGGARPKLSGTARSQLLQFADLAPLIGADTNAEKQQRGDTTLQPPDKVLPVEPFRTERWKSMDADVTFSSARIVRGKDLPIDSLTTHLVMEDGVLRLEPLGFGLAGGTVNSTIQLDGSQAAMRGSLKLHARRLKLKQLFPTFEAMNTSFGEINGDAALTAHGNSVAALLGSANGELKLLMNDGAISKTLLETAGLNVGNIVIGKLFGDKVVKINCAASDLAASNGLFSARLFVFDTEDAVVDIDGTLNFASEQLNLDVKPHTKGFRVFSLRSPLYVKGTLKHPDVGVQTGPLLLRSGGAVALGVFAAPVAALLPLVATSHQEPPNTCQTVLEQMRVPVKVVAPVKGKAVALRK